ncbi:hypothetical protein AVDCRST_MAG82-461, partial [uncultured Rubrobacteraceae bacterium]
CLAWRRASPWSSSSGGSPTRGSPRKVNASSSSPTLSSGGRRSC